MIKFRGRCNDLFRRKDKVRRSDKSGRIQCWGMNHFQTVIFRPFWHYRRRIGCCSVWIRCYGVLDKLGWKFKSIQDSIIVIFIYWQRELDSVIQFEWFFSIHRALYLRFHPKMIGFFLITSTYFDLIFDAWRDNFLRGGSSTPWNWIGRVILHSKASTQCYLDGFLPKERIYLLLGKHCYEISIEFLENKKEISNEV